MRILIYIIRGPKKTLSNLIQKKYKYRIIWKCGWVRIHGVFSQPSNNRNEEFAAKKRGSFIGAALYANEDE